MSKEADMWERLRVVLGVPMTTCSLGDGKPDRPDKRERGGSDGDDNDDVPEPKRPKVEEREGWALPVEIITTIIQFVTDYEDLRSIMLSASPLYKEAVLYINKEYKNFFLYAELGRVEGRWVQIYVLKREDPRDTWKGPLKRIVVADGKSIEAVIEEEHKRLKNILFAAEVVVEGRLSPADKEYLKESGLGHLVFSMAFNGIDSFEDIGDLAPRVSRLHVHYDHCRPATKFNKMVLGVSGDSFPRLTDLSVTYDASCAWVNIRVRHNHAISKISTLQRLALYTTGQTDPKVSTSSRVPFDPRRRRVDYHHLKALGNLQDLTIADTSVFGFDKRVAEYCNTWGLGAASCSNDKLDMANLMYIVSIAQLRRLSLPNTQMSSSLDVSVLGRLEFLEYLDLTRNPDLFSADAILTARRLASIRSLRELRIEVEHSDLLLLRDDLVRALFVAEKETPDISFDDGSLPELRKLVIVVGRIPPFQYEEGVANRIKLYIKDLTGRYVNVVVIARVRH